MHDDPLLDARRFGRDLRETSSQNAAGRRRDVDDVACGEFPDDVDDADAEQRRSAFDEGARRAFVDDQTALDRIAQRDPELARRHFMTFLARLEEGADRRFVRKRRRNGVGGAPLTDHERDAGGLEHAGRREFRDHAARTDRAAPTRLP